MRKPLKILLVEDHPDSAETLAQLLGLYGHHADITSDGMSAVIKWEQERHPLAFIDINLSSKIDGWMVAKAIRVLEGEMTQTILIALSAYDSSDDVRKSMQQGFDRHLAKPYDPKKLRTLIDSIADHLN